MTKTLGKYYNTLKYLKYKQVWFRLYYLFLPYLQKHILRRVEDVPARNKTIVLQPFINANQSFSKGQFVFLNQRKAFDEIDWEYEEFGKLWTYNLNYFDFLNQDNLATEEGLKMIDDFIAKTKPGATGLEAYASSLRIMNWIKFFSVRMIKNARYDTFLLMNANLLYRFPEYHLLGNHLLENAFALLFASYYFERGRFYEKAKSILTEQLKEQILPDGAHFELSPMYHQIMLLRILDAINLVKNNSFMKQELLDLLTEKATKMVTWLNAISYKDGSIPLLNDSANGIAPTTAELNQYAKRIGIDMGQSFSPHSLLLTPYLKQSGYRKHTGEKYEIIIDVGNIGPDYIPGHAHSDTFGFELCFNGQPFIVDTGTSTYETGTTRLSQRSTKAHNTVQIGDFEQSEVWASFRVARRAKIVELRENGNEISAGHDGYRRIGAEHWRTFRLENNRIALIDDVKSRKDYLCHKYLHFAPEIDVKVRGFCIFAGGIKIDVDGSKNIEIEDYYYAPEFNTLLPAKMVTIDFSANLKTTINL